MTLWFVLALMTAAAIFAVLWPLGRRAPERSGSSVAVYRHQLEEIDRDEATGLIPPREAEAARVEVSRRLIAAADAQEPRRVSSSHLRRGTAVAALLMVPAVAAALYLTLGSPSLPGAPAFARGQISTEARSIASLVSQVEAHIERNPNDGRGWEVLAPVYLRLGRVDDAVKARRRALELNGATAEREAELGEAMVVAANGVITADAKAAFDRAVTLDREHLKARFYLGMAAEQDGNRDEASRIWNSMLANAPADASWTEQVREALARIGAPVQPGPSAADVAAASALSESDRAEMVQGMVARLAERLDRDGSDVEGWLRLLRAYVVLGQRDKAADAATTARRALLGDPEKLRRIEELAKDLGLEGRG